ncbi:DUF1360 domain-containing protein [Cytobacillus spongiae]|uniref:DUF1360 domain-containing protein n=1 Tax=Cytobacillus spongiae TaxID=2901381 RepID=UPI001F2DD89D|nr:DUF1360 domain-containing protein [Cytobacillus spongiae]UII57042.1 DUF1360 domain-containing protein [Cytobacillus spongiae]
MDIQLMELIVFSLASFRLTRLIVFDKITNFIRAPFFEEVIEEDEDGQQEVYLIPKKHIVYGFFGELLSCYWCTGIWVTVALYAGYRYLPSVSIPVIVILAVAGVAAFIEALLQKVLDE